MTVTLAGRVCVKRAERNDHRLHSGWRAHPHGTWRSEASTPRLPHLSEEQHRFCIKLKCEGMSHEP